MRYIDKFYRIWFECGGTATNANIEHNISDIIKKLNITEYEIYKPNHNFNDGKKHICLENVKLGEPIHPELLSYKLVYIRNCYLSLEAIEVRELKIVIDDDYDLEGFYFKTDAFRESHMFWDLIKDKIAETERMIDLYGNK